MYGAREGHGSTTAVALALGDEDRAPESIPTLESPDLPDNRAI